MPPGGFPSRSHQVLNGRGLKGIEGRPGASLEPYDFEAAAKELRKTYGDRAIREVDVLSHALYPKVFEDWKAFEQVYGAVEELPTHLFLKPMVEGEECEITLETGKSYLVKMVSLPPPDADGIRQTIMEINGERWFVPITDTSIESAASKREKASGPGSVGAPMPGVVVDVKVKPGDMVREGEPLAVLSAMKMETVIPATSTGEVKRVLVTAGDNVEGDDLLAVIEAA